MISFFDAAVPQLFSLALTMPPLLFLATAAAQLTGLVSWSLFAQHVRGTVIGVRERVGKDFVAVYRYTDHLGVAQQAMSTLGSCHLRGKYTGTIIDLRVFPSRPEIVQEPRDGVKIRHVLIFSPFLIMALLFLLMLYAMGGFQFLRTSWLPGPLSLAAIALGIWWGRPGKPAEAEHNLGPLEAAENVSADRIKILIDANTPSTF